MTALRARLTVWVVLLAGAAALLGWVAWPRDGGDPFRALSAAPAVPGVGIGDLRVGETELGAFLTRYGAGVPAALFSDDTAIELAFPRAGWTLTFALAGACAGDVQAGRGTVLRAMSDPRRFLREHPACAGERLQAIVLSSAVGGSWRGEVAGGVRLGQPREEALAALGLEGSGVPETDGALPAPGPRWVSDPAGLALAFEPVPGDVARWRVARITVMAPW